MSEPKPSPEDIVTMMPDVSELPLTAIRARNPVLAKAVERLLSGSEETKSAFASFIELPSL